MVNAGAASSKVSSIFDTLKSKFSAPNTSSGTSLVNSYTTERMGNKSQVCTVETPKPEYLIQLRSWKTTQMEGVSNIQKLKHAYASIHLSTDDSSPIHGS
jgi:hypothetical protein